MGCDKAAYGLETLSPWLTNHNALGVIARFLMCRKQLGAVRLITG